MSGVEIKPACMRDASYIMAHLRPMDQLEVRCQIPDSVTMGQMTWFMLQSGDAFVAYLRNQPVMFFGTSTLNVAAKSIWAVGTERTPRVIPRVTRFVIHEHCPELVKQGFLILEARSLVQHAEAHRWMLSSGAKKSGEPFYYGAGRELFQLFRWTIDDFTSIQQGKWRPRT